MNLAKKKELAAKVFGVGKKRIYFNPEHLSEISEALTRQDILDLKEKGIIKIKEKNGRRKIEKRKHKRGHGKIKKRVRNKKQEYVKLTRKLRNYIRNLKMHKKIDLEKYYEIRKKIKAKYFRSLKHLQEFLKGEVSKK
ncbi:MAG: 50S ribosomal protein L19e [Candidatus Pacearchaeota archaeon]